MNVDTMASKTSEDNAGKNVMNVSKNIEFKKKVKLSFYEKQN